MNNHRLHAVRAGYTVIEILLGISIFLVFLTSISLYYKKILEVSKDTTYYIQSGFLIEEGMEVMKLLRNQSWSGNIASLTPGTTYYLSWTGTSWATTTTPVMIENMFTRSFVAAHVERDVNDNIVSSGGVADPGTKKIIFSVAWEQRGTRETATSSAEMYLTKIFDN